jgi:CRISPR-associated endonuclease Csn1
VTINQDGKLGDICLSDLRIFSEPLLPAKSGGVGEPKKAARRAARQARRLFERRARRLRRIAHLAPLLGLDPAAVPPDRGQRIHELRAKAIRERIELPDLLNVLLKLAKRRGYAGAFRVKKEGDEGQVESGIRTLKEQLGTHHCETLGEWFHHRQQSGESLKLKEIGLYAHREMVIEEFNRIWDEQQKHHPVLSRSAAVLGREATIRAHFFDAIFWQRPLKSVAPMVGNCALEPSLPRAPWAQPAAQSFRIEKQLADLRWGMGRNAKPLDAEQKDLIRKLLSDPETLTKEGKLSFKKIYAALDEAGLRRSTHRPTFSMDRASREELKGDTTREAFHALGVLDAWGSLSKPAQVQIINLLSEQDPSLFDAEDWPAKLVIERKIKDPATGKSIVSRQPRKLHEQTIAFIDALADAGKLDRLNKMGLDGGRAGYSLKALEKLTGAMQADGVDEYGAIAVCYPPSGTKQELKPQLPEPKSTGNVVVDVALRQVWHAVNHAIAALGEPPAQCIVELTRDMALGIKARNEVEGRIDRNRKERESAKKAISAAGKSPSDRNVLRYLLWSQLDQQYCPYCDKSINLEGALDGNQTNIDHILPRSLTRVGRQRAHLVLAHRACNNEKGDRTPFQAFGHDAERWNIIRHRASVLEHNRQRAKARLLLMDESEEEVLDDKAIADFSERQFIETSWIAKLTAQWLRDISPDVAVSRGELTAKLRRAWKLDTVVPQVRLEAGLPVLDQDGKPISLDDFSRYRACWEGHNGEDVEQTDRRPDKRLDHRHHLIDALVIAQTDRGLYQHMARQYKAIREQQREGMPVKLRYFPAPPMDNLRDRALEIVRGAEIRQKPDHYPSGAFFQDFAYSVAQKSENVRARLARKFELAKALDKKASLEQGRKFVASIVSDQVRDVVNAEFERRIASGKTPWEALSAPMFQELYGKKLPIKRVRCYTDKYAEDIALVSHQSRDGSVHVKRLLHAGFAYLEADMKNGQAVSPRLVPLIAANNRQGKSEDVMRLYKGDIVVDSKDGKRYRVGYFTSEGNIFLIPDVDPRAFDKIKEPRSGKKKISFGQLNRLRAKG